MTTHEKNTKEDGPKKQYRLPACMTGIRPKSAGSELESFILRHENAFVIALCVVAALRIFIFSAAFPFFNNVDEQAHFDTVVKSSRGYLPARGNNHYDRESANLIALYGSPEYLNEFHNPSSTPAPLYRISGEPSAKTYLSGLKTFWISRENHEASSPPVYYMIAGIWYRLGKILGLGGGHLLYWTRFLNIIIYAILLWFAHIFCAKLYSENHPVRFGVPIMLAFFPQNLFYFINSDVLSPLFFLVSLYLLIRFYTSDSTRLFHFMTGIAVALTLLVKLSNIPILAVFAALLLLRARRLYKEGRIKDQLAGLALLAFAVIAPVALWAGWNLYSLGDITGSNAKVASLGWKIKPLAEMWEHPIFTLNGASYFFAKLTETFWRGEVVWGLKNISSYTMDIFYIASSCLFLFAAAGKRINTRHRDFSVIRPPQYINIASLSIFILFLVAMSLVYNFGNSMYPSSSRPYFVSGRLISGALVPFLILYLDGMGVIISRITKRINPLVVVLLIALIITYSEIHLTYRVFTSLYNWYHLPW